jgi:hypothetical protein
MSLNEDLDKYSENVHTFLGTDTDGNSYWGATINGPAFVVVSKYGKVLDAFKRDKINYSNPQIAPNGDIYFWKIAKEGVTFYKITRRW